MEISKTDAEWMLTHYERIRGYGRVADWINDHCRVMSIIKGKEVSRPSCGCEFGSYARMANSMYEQHLAEIQAAANPVVESKTSTRAKKTTKG